MFLKVIFGDRTFFIIIEYLLVFLPSISKSNEKIFSSVLDAFKADRVHTDVFEHWKTADLYSSMLIVVTLI